MGLLDGIRSVLGMRAEADASRDADPEDLFGMSTAYLTMEAELGYEPMEEAALCFSGVDSVRFREAVSEVEAILEAGREREADFSITEDDHGYRWVVIEEADPEGLVTKLHFAADTFVEHGYGSRLLAAVFGYRDHDGEPAYWIYSFRRGAYYPFAPRPGRERDAAAEFKLESTLDGELEIEREKGYWYPLWPDRDGARPWV